MSKGEDQIAKLLKQHHQQFEREKIYPDLHGSHGAPLRFDFFWKNKEILIEVDGEQHFKEIPKFGGRAGYLAAKERDRKKNSYCLSHSIPLYRIPYWELSNIITLNDMLNPKFRVTNKFHNDYLRPPC